MSDAGLLLVGVVAGVLVYQRARAVEGEPGQPGRVVLELDPAAPGNWFTGAGRHYTPPPAAAPYLEQIHAAEDRHGIPRNLLVRLIQRESAFNPEAVNPLSGARGIAQFMPGTAADLGIDPMDPAQAINAAGQYLAWCRRYVGKDWAHALAAYNWGPGNVRRKGLAAAPRETREYVDYIAGHILGINYAAAVAADNNARA